MTEAVEQRDIRLADADLEAVQGGSKSALHYRRVSRMQSILRAASAGGPAPALHGTGTAQFDPATGAFRFTLETLQS